MRKNRSPRLETEFNTGEAAEIFGVNRLTIVRWIDDGKLKAHTTVGGHRKIYESDVLSLCKSKKIPVERVYAFTHPLRILIIEDNNASRRLIRRLCEEAFPKAEIHEAVDGLEGGYKICSLKPKLVILDIMLPGSNGISICKRVKKDPVMKGTKIIAITGHHSDKLKRILTRAKADAYLEKPFGKTFIEIAQQLLSKSAV